jgi:hypothetical protein
MSRFPRGRLPCGLAIAVDVITLTSIIASSSSAIFA